MKITFLVYNIYGMGGTVRTVVNTANYFASKNHDVEIISVRRTSAKPMFDIDKKVNITPIFDARRGKLFGKNTPLYQKIIKKILMKFPSFFIDKSEDLYHMFNLFVDFKIIAALKKINKGILITTIPSFNILATKFVKKDVIKIGQEHLYFAGHAPGLQNKIKKYYKKLDALTCLTDSEINDYEQLLTGSKVDLYKVENATDIPNETADLDKKVVIAAGRYAPEKGFDLLIPAFSKVIKKHPDWKLKIFGSGIEEEALREKIFEEKAYNNIFLMQKTNNIIGEMRNASIYALSSRYESFGMVIIEAMSVGVPCVGFACTGPREVITHKEDGILVEEGNVEELANSLMMLIESEELRKEYGRNAKKNVERYTFNVVGGKWENILEDQAQKTIKQDKKALAKVSI
ncbi:glycosyltransferase family 4 protein [Bacillus paramycoides]|uniref:glycosyltransferase family 4 protein n=1 Tax=Bacillus paramycoides TaxID=2026194 RepID=UPI000468042F|nr:glycosyltransferase family 4 protein [Bacillus paramycoides]MED1409531.1 glycosyltransferase family 4 protein [Bacillus paramycoides]MED1463124.1 glycosyltransferase family 4 protein [Bacillus paramycoides]MED1492742.1 glycosyltransferase family 4 protein [Bacillus paramycoides]PFD42992.1 glycosyltransferase family 4 protein [Bacillus cereus]